MKLVVDQKRCQGHGICLGIEPSVFVLNDDGYITLDGTFDVAPGNDDKVLLAVRCCPEQALDTVE